MYTRIASSQTYEGLVWIVFTNSQMFCFRLKTIQRYEICSASLAHKKGIKRQL